MVRNNINIFYIIYIIIISIFFCFRQLEQELQAWRLTVQSEHGLLEDRCSEMEVTMETLRQHHLRLQEMLTQVNLSKKVLHHKVELQICCILT